MHLSFSNIPVYIEIFTFSSKPIPLQWLFYLDYETDPLKVSARSKQWPGTITNNLGKISSIFNFENSQITDDFFH